MNTQTQSFSPQFLARLTGFIYLMIALIGGFAYFVVSEKMIVSGNAENTARNIINAEALFRLGIVSYTVILILDIFAAWTLYHLFKPVDKGLSQLAAWLRLTYVFIHGAALLNLISILQILESSFDVFKANQRDALILQFGQAHLNGFMVSLVFFGLHLVLLGYLICKSKFLPKLFSILLSLAGIAYIADTFTLLLSKNYSAISIMTEPIVAILAIIGEVGFLLWLLIKGVNTSQFINNNLAENPKFNRL